MADWCQGPAGAGSELCELGRPAEVKNDSSRARGGRADSPGPKSMPLGAAELAGSTNWWPIGADGPAGDGNGPGELWRLAEVKNDSSRARGGRADSPRPKCRSLDAAELAGTSKQWPMGADGPVGVEKWSR